MQNAVTRLSFNDLTEPVPNALSEIFHVMIQWRGFEVALNYDLSKAYQSIMTGSLELHLRRVVFREDPKQPWKTYGYGSVTFGDDPAACALELCKNKTARDALHVDFIAATQLICAGFVDDIGGGGSPEEVARMKGKKGEDGSYSGTLPKVLSYGGFHAKALVESGNCDDEEAAALGIPPES